MEKKPKQNYKLLKNFLLILVTVNVLLLVLTLFSYFKISFQSQDEAVNTLDFSKFENKLGQKLPRKLPSNYSLISNNIFGRNMQPTKIKHDHICPCCGHHGSFTDSIHSSNAMCPICDSLRKDRRVCAMMGTEKLFPSADKKPRRLLAWGTFDTVVKKKISELHNIETQFIDFQFTTNKKFENNFLTNIDFSPSEIYDIILIHEVLERFINIEKTIKELSRVLKTNRWMLVYSECDKMDVESEEITKKFFSCQKYMRHKEIDAQNFDVKKEQLCGENEAFYYRCDYLYELIEKIGNMKCDKLENDHPLSDCKLGTRFGYNRMRVCWKNYS